MHTQHKHIYIKMEVIAKDHWILQSLDVKDALYNTTYYSCSNHSWGSQQPFLVQICQQDPELLQQALDELRALSS